ncbi:MAG: FtsW/RodA/SpoVE family cell cycle protein, partial [Chloroflexi bacterium]|nr:FtsW/RodA/SpoVE family cell cycle protein [Chloroflexota bacterium]
MGRLTVRREAHAPDYALIIVTLALLCIGIVMVYSASVVQSYAEYGDQTYFFLRQLGWCMAGLVVMFLAMRVPYSWWRRMSVLGMAVSVGLLIAVLLPGVGNAALGATRWIRVGGVNIGQPSELCKVTLAIYMADWLSRKGERVKEFRYGLLPFLVVLLAVTALVMKQPDMGTTLVIIGSAVTIFFVSGANLLQLIPMGALGVLG